MFFDYGGTNRVAKYAMYKYYSNCNYDTSIPYLSAWPNLIDPSHVPSSNTSSNENIESPVIITNAKVVTYFIDCLDFLTGGQNF